jgi:hypothetical protein
MTRKSARTVFVTTLGIAGAFGCIVLALLGEATNITVQLFQRTAYHHGYSQSTQTATLNKAQQRPKGTSATARAVTAPPQTTVSAVVPAPTTPSSCYPPSK